MAVVGWEQMPSSSWVDISGEGTALISSGSNVVVLSIQWDILTITSPRVRELHTSVPHGLQYAGTLILFESATDYLSVARDFVTWVQHITYARGDPPVLGGESAYKLGWRLPAGISGKARVWW
jgi:hypothetical protein